MDRINLSAFKHELFWEHDAVLIHDLRKPDTYRKRVEENLMTIFKALGDRTIDRATLSKLAKHRRKVFLAALKKIVNNGTVERYGRGRKGSPFSFQLAHDLRVA